MATPQRVSSFEPSVWDDFFVQYEPEPFQISEECMKVKADKLKDDVCMLFKTFNNGTVVDKMILLDALQRLGIDHLFQEQINTAIKGIYESESNCCSLYEAALRFRLLREHGHWVSPGEDGSFNKNVTKEPMGLLCLYNAAYLSIHGESELDEAISFARHHLESMGNSLNYPLSEQVKRNLEIPLPRISKRLDVPYYIAEYKHEQECNPLVLELAKLEFNLLQRLHQSELKAYCRWANDLYEDVGLSYSRHRMVECYFWSYNVYYEQHYGGARIILAKLIELVCLLDDTFDIHATLEEGRKLNEAIQRWDESAIPILPEYLKKYYIRLMDTYRELEDELKQDHKYRIVYCRKAVIYLSILLYYQQEAEWFHNSYTPSFEDHVKCSVISAATPFLCIGLLVGMGEEATKEAFEWALGCTDAVKSCGEVTRFMDDMAAFKQGKVKMDVASTIDSYINQHHVTSEVAIAVMDNMVEDAWRTINQTRFDRRALLPLVNRVAGLTKNMTWLFHDKIDRYTFSRGNKDKIEQQFIEPIPL
ncbi:hypothetical protein BRADI_5g01823v3 [Brachypodium distachyon]|uniref:Terpene synthase n=1 Tax=Brachypodium distachyon TaxID=15368 RepID=A0A0Q3H0P8_BRADI|nr:hypothetical protein BRADI_5g01823v3 [Brachypodium distachyon]